MVDPPPFSSQFLKKLGIPSILIEWIIISHCHADHDAGTFQKILEATRVEVTLYFKKKIKFEIMLYILYTKSNSSVEK